MLEVGNLACSRGDHRLFSGLSFTLHPGQLMQVQGANGSGKTSLLRTLCGFIRPDDGEIRWRGKPVGNLGEDYYAELLYLGHLNAINDEWNIMFFCDMSNGVEIGLNTGNVVDCCQNNEAGFRIYRCFYNFWTNGSPEPCRKVGDRSSFFLQVF